jgi:hypothetical protein
VSAPDVHLNDFAIGAFDDGSGIKEGRLGPRSFSHWVKFAVDAQLLTLEAQQVIAMRMMKLSLGGTKGAKEARRMVSEKVFAAGEAGFRLAKGGSGHSIVRHYRRKVRANRRRLAK